MSLSNSKTTNVTPVSSQKFNIHMFKKSYCLNDVLSQTGISNSPKEYIKKIDGKILHKGNYYVSKTILIDILTKSKAPKSKELLDYLVNNKEDEITSEQIINFVDNGKNLIHFNDQSIKYVYVKQQIYFKAKEIALALGYTDTKSAVIDHIDSLDKITANEIKGGGILTPPHKTNEQLKIEQILGNEDGKTIFINESGLYSLILGSKKPEAKKFKHWVTSEVLPAIRQYGSYSLSNKLAYSMDKLDDYKGHEIVYVINVKDNIYKFGQTYKVDKRMESHASTLNFNHIVKLYKLPNRTISLACEDKIKILAKKLKIKSTYNNGLEFFETNGKYTIDFVIQSIDEIVNVTLNEYNNKSHEIVPFADVNNLVNLCARMESYCNEFLKLKEQNLMMVHVIQQLNTIQEKIELAKEKEQFYQIQLKQIDLEIKRVELEIVKAKPPSLIQQLIDAKIIGNGKINTDSVDLNVTEELEEKTETGTKKLTTSAKITNGGNKKCSDCSCDIYFTSIRCPQCENNKRLKTCVESAKDRPSLTQIQEDLINLKSYVQVGKKYGVSDNCIRKWIKSYNKYNQIKK